MEGNCHVDVTNSDPCCQCDDATWLTAVTNNNVNHVQEILASASNSKNILLNKRFTNLYDDMGARAGYFLARYRVDNAVLAAVVNGSRDVLQCLLDHGADPLITDEHDDNIAHTVVSIVTAHPQLEDVQLGNLEHFLNVLPIKQRQNILKTENKLRLRPLEYALYKGCITLFKCIFQTPGVYVQETIRKGRVIFDDYDITEYENGNRRGRSPLVLICLARDQTMQKPEFAELLNWHPIKQWITCKVKTSAIPGTIWALSVFWYYIAYHLIKFNQPAYEGGIPHDVNYGSNASNDSFVYCYQPALLGWLTAHQSSFNALLIYGIVHSVLIILFDMELVSSSHRVIYMHMVNDKLTSRHVFLPNCVVRLFIHISAWGILVYYVIVILGITIRGNTWFSITNLITDLTLFAYQSYMLMLVVPMIRSNATLIAAMFIDLLYFLLLGLIATIPYTLFFMDFVNTNTLEGCIVDFKDLGRTFYRVILVMLNIRDMAQYNTTANMAFLIGHVITAAVLGILYLNFVIANMTLKVSAMSHIRDVVMHLHTLPIVLTIDGRMNRISKRYSSYYIKKYLKVLNNKSVFLSSMRTLHEL